MYVMRVATFLDEHFVLLRYLPLETYFGEQKKIIMDIIRKKHERTCIRLAILNNY